MSSTKVFANHSTSWTDAANWGGSALATGDTAIIDQGDKPLTANADLSAVKDLTVKFKKGYKGTSIGASGAPFKFGSTGGTGTIEYDCPDCTEAYIETAAVASVRVYNCAEGANGFNYSAGAPTNLHIVGGPGVKLGAALTPTNVYIHRNSVVPVVVTLASGLTVATLIEVHGGQIYSYAAFPELKMHGGTWEHLGDTTFDGTTLTVQGDAVFKLRTSGVSAPTFGTVNLKGYGYIDAQDARATFTNTNAWGPGTLDCGDVCQVTFTNAASVYGAHVIGVPAASLSIIVPELPGGIARR
jgi:hypothetical protein